MWDDLRTHFNGMVLDSCASGDRRNNSESMRRAVSLHITDFFINNLPLRQSIHQSLYQWFPRNIDFKRYLAFSFIDSVAGEGFIQLYRRDNAPETQVIRLKGLDAEQIYDILDFDENCGGRFHGAE